MPKKTLRETLASKMLYELELSKKENEASIMVGFLERVGLNQFTIVSRECPDFEILFKTKDEHFLISCELTEFAADMAKHGSQERRFQKLWLKFAHKLRSRLQEEQLENFYGAVHFKTSDRTSLPTEQSEFIDEIIVALKNALSKKSERKAFTVGSSGYPVLEEHVEQISVWNTAPENNLLWWCGHLQTGTVASLESIVQALHKIVKNKDKAAKNYNWPPNSKEKWLVIYAPSRGLQDMVNIIRHIQDNNDWGLLQQISSLSFDRIFLWDKWGENIYQLCPDFQMILEDASILYVKHMPLYLKEIVLSAE